MDCDTLGLYSVFVRVPGQDIFRDFLDSGHPLALDGQRYATAASACLKIIFKHYQVPLPRLKRFSRHFHTLILNRGARSQPRHTPLGLPDTHSGLGSRFHQVCRSRHLRFLLKKSAYSDRLLNFAHRKVFVFGYLHRNHPTYIKMAIFALARYIHRITGRTAELDACESIWGRARWFIAK